MTTILRCVKLQALKVHQAKQLAEFAREVGEPMPAACGATAGGDAIRLRGIPVLGKFGIGGAIAGTRPDTRNYGYGGRS